MKRVISTALLVVLSTSVMSTEALSPNGKGFYVGVGAGYSSNTLFLTEGNYNYSDPDNPTYTFSSSSLDDNDVGYMLYAGYQINKIIALEVAYTNYGHFAVRKFAKEYAQSPNSLSVYANAGYMFFNNQLRPFGNIGLGYLQKNQSSSYDRLDFDKEIVTIHSGIGVDYYPTILKGIGFRAAFSGDTAIDSVYTVNDNNTTESKTLWQAYNLFYLGIEYKF